MKLEFQEEEEKLGKSHQNLASLNLKPGDKVLLTSGEQLAIFLGYWYPGCRLELLETGKVVHRLLDAEATLVQEVVETTTATAKVALKVCLPETLIFEEIQVLDAMCTHACSREEAAKILAKKAISDRLDVPTAIVLLGAGLSR